MCGGPPKADLIALAKCAVMCGGPQKVDLAALTSVRCSVSVRWSSKGRFSSFGKVCSGVRWR